MRTSSGSTSRPHAAEEGAGGDPATNGAWKRADVDLQTDGRGLGAASYNASYFARLYGGSTNGHGPSQTVLDRARDVRIVHLLERYAPRREGRALLDIGCGYGWILARLGDSFERYGVDLSPHAVTEARRCVKGATFAAADIQEGLPFSRRFEAVAAVNVLEHLRDPERTIRTMYHVLVPGGIAVVHLPTIDNSVGRMIYKLTYEQDPTHVYRPSSTQVRDRFEAMGFDLVAHSHSPHLPAPLWRALPWHPAYLAVFRRPPGS